MGNVASDLWPHVVTALFAILGTYFTLIHNMKERIAILEHKCESMQKRVDSHSGKIDNIVEGISDIKLTLVKICTKLNIEEKS